MPVGPLPAGLKIRVMEFTDLDFVTELSQSLGWSTTRATIENFWSFEPKGCFVAELEEEVVGSVTTTPYTHYAWVGMMLVREDLRRHRIGSSLMKKALQYLRKKNIRTIRLEADPPGVPLYEHLNFVKECDSGRWFREMPPTQTDPNIREATQTDLETIWELDKEAFGDNRKRVLSQLFKMSDFSLVHKDTPRSGMLMARKTAWGITFGPFIAATPQLAEQLLCSGLSRIENHPVVIGIPATHQNALTLLKKYNFIEKSILNRMYLGNPPIIGNRDFEYGIATSATG